MPIPTLDLNAAKREAQYPEGVAVELGPERFLLPSELPADVFSPFLADDLNLVELLRDVLGKQDPGDTTIRADVLSLLFARPALPKQLVTAIQESLKILFGEDQYKRFADLNPSLPDYGRLVRWLSNIYGASLGEAFGSLVSRVSTGETSKATSNGSTPASTPATSGGAPQIPAS